MKVTDPVQGPAAGGKALAALKSRHPARIAIGLVIVIAVVAGTASFARAHGGDTGQIHACVTTGSGTVRLVGPSSNCLPTEFALDWPGRSGVAGWERVERSAFALPPHGTIGGSQFGFEAGATATCPAGKKVQGGGFELPAQFRVHSSSPTSDGTGWRVVFMSDGSMLTFRVYAICALVL